jgi:hypothetical protein
MEIYCYERGVGMENVFTVYQERQRRCQNDLFFERLKAFYQAVM